MSASRSPSGSLLRVAIAALAVCVLLPLGGCFAESGGSCFDAAPVVIHVDAGADIDCSGVCDRVGTGCSVTATDAGTTVTCHTEQCQL